MPPMTGTTQDLGARRKHRLRTAACAALLVCLLATPSFGKSVLVRDADGLREAARRAVPGSRIELEPGEYTGGLHLAGLQGTAAKPIVIAARDPKKRPVIRGGMSGLQVSDPAHLVLQDLILVGARGNGLNIDDGGTLDTPAHHVTLRRIAVRDVGPAGNRDGIKLSGVQDLVLEDCVVERWGDAGSAVDMVGCRRVVITGCTFRHKPHMTRGSGIQAKGGSEDILIRGNRFENAGARGVNAGGSTGFEFFRPSITGRAGPLAEARSIRVLGNTFLGGGAAVAFVGVDGAKVAWNTIYRPARWAFRILQETRDKRFVPSRRGVIKANLIVFESDAWSEGGVNVGAGTAPDTFTFTGNAWYCADAPRRTRALVRLPVKEKNGMYGVDPRLVDPDRGDLRIGKASKLRAVGVEGCPAR